MSLGLQDDLWRCVLVPCVKQPMDVCGDQTGPFKDCNCTAGYNCTEKVSHSESSSPSKRMSFMTVHSVTESTRLKRQLRHWQHMYEPIAVPHHGSMNDRSHNRVHALSAYY